MEQELLLIAILFIFIDYFYLSYSFDWFNSVVMTIQNAYITPKHLGFVLAYASIVFQFYYFVVKKDMSITDAFILGFTTYAIFDFTNYTIFTDYPLNIGIMDTIWGGTLYATVAYLTNKFLRS